VESVYKQDDGSLIVKLSDSSTIEVNAVLYATGRKPKLDDLGLENLNINLTENGFIEVNECYQTSEPSVYAVGDVIDSLALTPVALEEGMALARHLYQQQPCELDYSNIATTVFSQPNIGSIGLTEEQARSQFPNILKYRSYYRAMRHNLSGSDERSLMKIIVNADNDKVVGMHMVGADAGEIMQGFAAAIKAGATKADFDATVGIHPTAAEEFVTMREPLAE
jgi:glutathione reductase (NADPH)